MKDVTSFLEEAVVMKDFNHSNVLSLLGVAIKDNKQPFVILPYMEHGDLKSYISSPDRVCFTHCIFQLENIYFLYLLLCTIEILSVA